MPSRLIGEDPFDIPNNLMPYIAKVASGTLPHLNSLAMTMTPVTCTGERDYIHVCDLARGHVLSVQKLLSTHEGHVVNLGTGQAYSVLEMNATYSQAVGRDLPYVIAPRPAGDVPTFVWPTCARPRRFWALKLNSVWLICVKAHGIGSKPKRAAKLPVAVKRLRGS